MSGTSDANAGQSVDGIPSGAQHAPATDPVPSQGCLLGIDFGTKRVGFAICDDRQVIVIPLETSERTVEAVEAKHLQQIVEDYRIRGLVIGLPVHMSGDESRGTHLVRRYGDWARSVTGLPVAYWDERFSSATADVRLMAAGIMDTPQGLPARHAGRASHLAVIPRCSRPNGGTNRPQELRSAAAHIH